MAPAPSVSVALNGQRSYNWQLQSLLPRDLKNGSYYSGTFQTCDGQKWCLDLLVESASFDCYLTIKAPVLDPTKKTSFTLRVGSIAKSCSHVFKTPEEGWGLKGLYQRKDMDFTESLVLEIEGDVSIFGFYTKMLNNEAFSDCSFLVEGQAIYAMKGILCAGSVYFQRMFRTGFADAADKKNRPIPLKDLSYDAVLACFEWLYTGRVSTAEGMTGRTLLDTCVAAETFGLNELGQGLRSKMLAAVDKSCFGDVLAFALARDQTELALAILRNWNVYMQAPLLDNTEESKAEAKEYELAMSQLHVVMDSVAGNIDSFKRLMTLASTNASKTAPAPGISAGLSNLSLH